MKKILLLITDQPGDAMAAANLADAISQAAPRGARCEVVDLFRELAASLPKWQLFSLGSTFRAGTTAPDPRLRDALRDLLRETEPDAVVTTSPIYHLLIEEIYRDGRRRDFAVVALLLDAALEGDWARVTADRFAVVHETVAEALRAAGVDRDRIELCAFPRAPGRPRLLYIINKMRRKAPKILDRLLEHADWDVTVRLEGAGAGKVEEMAREKEENASGRLRVLHAHEPLPELLAAHDLVISRADPAMVHEAVAAACPLIALRPESAREKSSFAFLRQANAAAAAEKPRDVAAWIERALQDEGRLLELWRANLTALRATEKAGDLARLVLDAAATPVAPVLRALPSPPRRGRNSRATKRLLLCDLHTHTTWSDGKLSVPELVDFYGQRQFDCLCITDHLCDPNRLLGRLVNLTGLVIPPDRLDDYFAEIEREKRRAWDEYELILMTGIEFNKDGYTPKSSAHLLGVDLQRPIDPTLDLKRLIIEIQAQGGLAIASHPHEIKSEWGKNTLYLWEHLEEYGPLLDLWEVANRDDIFNPIGLKKLPFMANSDFHKPKHIHSWKTVLHCEKEPEAIKQCLRVNRDVSLTLYRDHRFGAEAAVTPETMESVPELVPFKENRLVAKRG